MKYILKEKSKVTKDEILQLQYLRFKDGLMFPRFMDEEEGDVILCKSNDIILGWAYIYADSRRDNPTFFVYVKKDFRRLGIGTKLYEIGIKKYKKLWTSKFNKNASKFFESVE